MKMTRTVIGLSIDELILHKIDQMRGLVPRSRYLEQIIREKIGG